MLTEQEAVAKLNEKILKKEIKPTTSRYLAKIETLKNILKKQQSDLKDLVARKELLEADIQRSKGAISILLELAAEDEGMLSDVVETPKTT